MCGHVNTCACAYNFKQEELLKNVFVKAMKNRGICKDVQGKVLEFLNTSEEWEKLMLSWDEEVKKLYDH